ncbi:tetratricopeptide repeat protein [Pectobacteriaceae bacterium CE90]|nr:tetratricopeptide repeat protein [Prodigiosinella sp. LS101]WJV54107.1 tetratricopeptide repeat protein [Prodigiosinella sp. LS101]WJV58470.1 tetratricopeptide repeat protein [Pectobacteriaceae bacterium C111]WJY14880.1 tetratricopeptide repeat protein [Pectobacteriaceae bacterium CE90]
MVNTTNDINAATRGLLLRMGNAWFEQNELRQAVDIYLKIIEQYPDSKESKTAQTALLTISQRYERDGLFRLSLDLLERVGEITPTSI